VTATRAVSVGDSIGTAVYTPTRVTLFLFGVAHWTAHRIHYDTEWARAEGYPDVVVVGQLLSAWQVNLLSSWAGDPSCLRHFTERNTGLAFAGETLTVTGEVVAVRPGERELEVECSISVSSPSHQVAQSHALLRLPAGLSPE
jgi:hydroxyacyl-ACP dehydratase HTD2-like protein with hotdog domain